MTALRVLFVLYMCSDVYVGMSIIVHTNGSHDIALYARFVKYEQLHIHSSYMTLIRVHELHTDLFALM